jgi:hypothetical protein
MFICLFFDDAGSSSDYSASNGMVIDENKL